MSKGMEVAKGSTYSWSRKPYIWTGVRNVDRRAEGHEAGRRTCT